MNALIIYDDSDSAAGVSGMLERTACRSNESVPWAVRSVRLDRLVRRPFAVAGFEHAVEAHLILIALHAGADVVATWPLDWLETWAEHRQVQEAAVALWDGGNGGELSAKAAPELSRFAERHGLSLIFEGNASSREGKGFFARDAREDAAIRTRSLPSLHKHPARCCSRAKPSTNGRRLRGVRNLPLAGTWAGRPGQYHNRTRPQ